MPAFRIVRDASGAVRRERLPQLAPAVEAQIVEAARKRKPTDKKKKAAPSPRRR